LWPGLSERARVAAAHELERVTRAVLAGQRAVRLDPDHAHDTYALAIAGHTTGLAPLCGRWVGDGTMSAEPAVARRFAVSLAHARSRIARIEREVAPAFDAIEACGISLVVLKGFHTAHTYFEEPGLRRMADVDVLIPANRVDDVEAALSSAGFCPTNAALRPYKRDWIGPHAEQRVYSLEVSHENNPWALELHTSLDRVFHAGSVARIDAVAGDFQPCQLAGRRVLVLGQPALLLTLASHCSHELDGSRLLRLLEMVGVIRADIRAGRLDWDAMLQALHQTRAARFTYPALALVEDLAPGTVDGRVLALGRKESTWAARHTVDRLVPAGGSLDQRGVLRQAMWARGPRGMLQRVFRTFWPASFSRPDEARAAWRVRLRRIRTGVLSLRAPNERPPRRSGGTRPR
jgi:hypothetical protein